MRTGKKLPKKEEEAGRMAKWGGACAYPGNQSSSQRTYMVERENIHACPSLLYIHANTQITTEKERERE